MCQKFLVVFFSFPPKLTKFHHYDCRGYQTGKYITFHSSQLKLNCLFQLQNILFEANMSIRITFKTSKSENINFYNELCTKFIITNKQFFANKILLPQLYGYYFPCFSTQGFSRIVYRLLLFICGQYTHSMFRIT